jgi:hypothetical protein
VNNPVRSRHCQNAGDRLRAQVRLGIAALRRGDFDEVDSADLHVYLKSLTDRGGAYPHERMDPTAHLDATTQRGTPGKKRRP